MEPPPSPQRAAGWNSPAVAQEKVRFGSLTWHGRPDREDTRKMRVPHLTLLDRVRIFEPHGDVAELADAQVSEACDGDIVEVQVLSSPPKIEGEPLSSPFLLAGSWSADILSASVRSMLSLTTSYLHDE